MSVHPDGLPGHPNPRRIVFEALAAAIRPPEPVPFSKWLTQNLVLVDGPAAGELWSPDGAPYLPEIADCLGDDHPCNLVTIRKSQQSGASILALGWSLYIADREPANTLYAVPGIDALRDLNSGKLQPLIEAWQRRTGRIVMAPQTSRSGVGSTTYEKVYMGGRLYLANANAVMDLSAKTVKKGVKDELSKWERLDNGADPETLFFGRFTAFRRERSYKILEISTPEVDLGDELVEGHCRIDASFRRSDQRMWNCSCPECERLFVHKIERLQIDKAHPHRTTYECFCGHQISESERVLAVRAGRWIASEEGPDRHPGFHIDAFISLMMSYEAIAEDWLRAQASETAKKDFANLVLGLPYRYSGDAPDHVRLMTLREDYPRGRIPAKGLMLVAAADVQMNAIYVVVIAYAADRQSWVVDADIIVGDTSDPHGGAFAELSKVYEREYPDAFGGSRRVDAFGVDSGFRAHVVYTWCRGRPNAFATKGGDGWPRPPISTPSLVDVDFGGRKIKQGATVWTIGTWSLKAEWFADLSKRRMIEGEKEDPSGACHHALWLEENYFQQVTNEFLADERHRGRLRRVWKERGPNHFLDCRIIARALVDYLGISRLTADEWAQLAKLRGAPTDTIAPDLLAPEAVRIAAPATSAAPASSRTKSAPSRRSTVSSFMG